MQALEIAKTENGVIKTPHFDMDVLQFVSQRPHWLVQTLIAILLGSLMPRLGRILFLIFRWFKKDYLVGEWYKYHLSYKYGEPELFETTWLIRRGFLNPYRITYNHSGKSLIYRGSMKIEKDQMLFVLKASSHQETVIYRTNNPIPSANKYVYGLWMSYDHDVKIASGATLMCRKKMPKDKAFQEILARFRFEKDRPLVRLNL
ncbi:MAG: hypothetical protein AAGH78_00880 [Cyanobacteria bacterium P01_H01_bin.58]